MPFIAHSPRGPRADRYFSIQLTVVIGVVSVETRVSVVCDNVALLEYSGGLLRDSTLPIEYRYGILRDVFVPLEFTAALGAITEDATVPIEIRGGVSSSLPAVVESNAGVSSNLSLWLEVLQGVTRDASIFTEYVTSLINPLPISAESVVSLIGNLPISLESTASITIAQAILLESAASIVRDAIARAEVLSGISRDAIILTELVLTFVAINSSAFIEILSQLTSVLSDLYPTPLEFLSGAQVNAPPPIEYRQLVTSLSQDAVAPLEVLAAIAFSESPSVEFLARTSGDSPLPLEVRLGIVSLSQDAAVPLEFNFGLLVSQPLVTEQRAGVQSDKSIPIEYRTILAVLTENLPVPIEFSSTLSAIFEDAALQLEAAAHLDNLQPLQAESSVAVQVITKLLDLEYRGGHVISWVSPSENLISLFALPSILLENNIRVGATVSDFFAPIEVLTNLSASSAIQFDLIAGVLVDRALALETLRGLYADGLLLAEALISHVINNPIPYEIVPDPSIVSLVSNAVIGVELQANLIALAFLEYEYGGGIGTGIKSDAEAQIEYGGIPLVGVQIVGDLLR